MDIAYTAFGLAVVSDIELPMQFARSGDAMQQITIRQGPVPNDGTEFGPALGPFSHARPNAFWLSVPGVAHFSVRDGCEVVYDPVDGIDADSVRAFLLGSVLATVMIQRGHLVLHGNAVEIGASAVICCGVSGMGKSTLAAALMQAGQRIVADDICPMDDDSRILPGAPRIKLWQDSADKLGITTKGLARIRPGMGKFSVPLGPAHCPEPRPVTAVYMLGSHPEPDFQFEELSGTQVFEALREQSYRFRFVEGLGQKAKHLQACARLASQAAVIRVLRPRGSFQIERLVDVIRDDAMRRAGR